ncbi:MAG: methyltransferase [bacterium]|nr:methyltransferase [bacterium]
MLKLGEILFKYRDYTPLPFIVVMLWLGQANQESLIAGSLLMILGELVRVHGVAYIGGVSRTRSYSTGQKVISGGPFAHVRNPLYIGNLLLSGGLVVVSNVHFFFAYDFVVFFVLVFFAQYIPVVAWEESNLVNKFGQAYEDYRHLVPRWFPRLTRAETPGVLENIQGEYARAIKSEKNTLTTAVILYLAILWRSGFFNSLGA